MNWIATTCISIYTAGLFIIPTVFGIYYSREIKRGHFDWDDYVIFLVLWVIWPITLSLVALSGIGYVIGRALYLIVKWWIGKCAKFAENWKEGNKEGKINESESAS